MAKGRSDGPARLVMDDATAWLAEPLDVNWNDLHGSVDGRRRWSAPCTGPSSRTG